MARNECPLQRMSGKGICRGGAVKVANGPPVLSRRGEAIYHASVKRVSSEVRVEGRFETTTGQ